MPTLSIAITGPGANEAARDLLGGDVLRGEVDGPREPVRSLDVESVAQVAGIVGGAVAAADFIWKW